MPRLDVNRSGEMEAFVQVVERGGFSAAARVLGMTPSAISKLVGRLEARLGTQLVHRSTRKLQLSAEGQQFYERAVQVLADLDEAERAAGADAEPRGRVTLNTSVSFGTHVLVPLVPRFLAQHPQLSLDVALTDRVIDLMDERADIAIRWGPLPASDLVARRLGETGQVIVGSPAYLAERGTPQQPADLAAHHLLDFSYRRRMPDWPLLLGSKPLDVPVRGRIRASDGETLRNLALAGAGLARLSRYHIQHDLDAGRLIPVLERFNPDERAPIHAVYLGRSERLPARVRAVLAFLVEHVGCDPRFTTKPPLNPR
ncbi:MAG TPA: LysR family transcriptional regulator [Ideonella sp.]|uniref:LysR family transcriptional regulator n=1 Tax=Ideonella sp. TaxID=1929293 RepID=UPI002C95F7FB|nr:LysR family transcriptional regulator [Ideonella sp.]HSI48580.1 LysR family transcriptional regulator [Ideonella sp.]